MSKQKTKNILFFNNGNSTIKTKKFTKAALNYLVDNLIAIAAIDDLLLQEPSNPVSNFIKFTKKLISTTNFDNNQFHKNINKAIENYILTNGMPQLPKTLNTTNIYYNYCYIDNNNKFYFGQSGDPNRFNNPNAYKNQPVAALFNNPNNSYNGFILMNNVSHQMSNLIEHLFIKLTSSNKNGYGYNNTRGGNNIQNALDHVIESGKVKIK